MLNLPLKSIDLLTIVHIKIIFNTFFSHLIVIDINCIGYLIYAFYVYFYFHFFFNSNIKEE